MNFFPIVSLFGISISFVFSANFQNEQDLFNAAAHGNIENVRNLVEVVGVPANILDGEALIEAAENGRLEVVRFLVGEGPEDARVPANIRDGAALINATRNGHLEVVRYLLESYSIDFDVDQCNRALYACNRSEYMNREVQIEINALIEAYKAIIEFCPK